MLSGILIQNLKNETHWHLRGIRRIGVSQEDVERIHQCVRLMSSVAILLNGTCGARPNIIDYISLAQIELVADFARVRVDRVPRAADIEKEV